MLRQTALSSFLVLFLIYGLSALQAQNSNRFWTMGVGSTPGNIEFNSTGNQFSSPWTSHPNPGSRANYGTEGTTMVNDPQTGSLIFYTDGNWVYDPNHVLVNPNNPLGGHPSCSQGSLVLQDPACPNDSYYIFSNETGTDPNGAIVGTITYRKYNPMTGGFLPALNQSPILLPSPLAGVNVGEGMALVPNPNDPRQFWLLANTMLNNDQYVFSIDSSGVSYHATFSLGAASSSTTGINDYGYTYPSARDTTMGEIAFSRHSNGNKSVWSCLFDPVNGNYAVNSLFSVAGNFTNGIILYNEWSPNGRYLYYSTYFPIQVYQYDILLGTTQTLFANPASVRGGGMRVGPNDKLYFISETSNSPSSPGNTNVGVINTPDLSIGDPGFQFSPSIITFSSLHAYQFPISAQFVDEPCDTCPSVQASLSVQVGTNPGLFTFFQTTSPTADSLIWVFGDGNSQATAGNTGSVMHTYSQSGLYNAYMVTQYYLSDSSLCTDTFTIEIGVDIPTGVEAEALSVLNEARPVELRLFNTLGQELIHDSKFMLKDMYRIRRELSQGVYFIQIRQGDFELYRKVYFSN